MKLTYKIILGILICTFCSFYWLSNITEGEYYRRHSPDGQYSIYASRDKYFNFKIPFVKFSDAGGKIHLYDELENKLVGSSSIDMISNINELFWTENELYSKGSMRNIKLPRKIHSNIIQEYEKSIPVKNSRSLFIQGKHYIVSEVSHKKLVVSNESGKPILQDIQHISQINNGFQVLNKQTEIEYYDVELNKLEKPTSQVEYYEVCGNVTTYGFKIEESKKYYVIKKAVGHTNYKFKNYSAIDSVKKAEVKDIYFFNEKRELIYNSNFLEKELVIVDYGSYFCVLSEQYGVEYFESIDLSKKPIKVMRNNLYGYYGITPTIYLDLEPFEFNLAKFQKIGTSGKNRKGYVDIQGNEYYQ